MDPLSASCFSLSSQLSSRVLAQKTTHDKYSQILGSTVSISNYEQRNLKNLTPQIIAAILVTSYHVSIGISLAFSAILLPQLEENADFEVTKSDASWIVALTNPAGSLMVGVLMDYFGRLRTLTLAAIPGLGGCVLMALSQNVSMLITGRALVGLSSALGSSPAIVYLTEIARKDMRGSLISLAPALTSLGMVLTFIMGWFMNWRQVAWLSTIFTLVPCFLVFFIPESPAWLVSKDKIEEAKKSLMWINKYQPQPENKTQTYSELQLTLLQKEHELKLIEDSRRTGNEIKAKFYEFLKPTGYKPLIILTGMFMFQQFSGIFIFLFFSISFFQEVGSTSNPYLTSIFIGVVRFIMSMINTYVQRAYGRRSLLLISCFGMSLFIVLSGLFAHWIKTGTTTMTWIPVVCLLMFVVASMIGVIPIPYTMTAELFPLEIRGVAHSVSICIASFVMFLSLQLYPVMFDLFGGISGVQYFFGGVTLVGAVYVYVFSPETQEKKLSEIEEYFRNNVVYIGKKKEKEVKRVPVKTVHSIVRKQEHEEHLLEEV
ncbi:facilitated trehalose transporter Tret1-like isoform X2 [Zophobas morio]|uniref:facilitated trehalose transporter Tret1-like isoform X2 n=1 Tax=Zophobas morio TaxID=2755281 RepID=UPI0030838909